MEKGDISLLYGYLGMTATVGTGNVGVISPPEAQAQPVSEFDNEDFENTKLKH